MKASLISMKFTQKKRNKKMMKDRWDIPNKTFCKYCNKFIQTNIWKQHESNNTHQNNVKRWLREEEKRKKAQKHQDQHVHYELQRIGQAAAHASSSDAKYEKMSTDEFFAEQERAKNAEQQVSEDYSHLQFAQSTAANTSAYEAPVTPQIDPYVYQQLMAQQQQMQLYQMQASMQNVEQQKDVRKQKAKEAKKRKRLAKKLEQDQESVQQGENTEQQQEQSESSATQNAVNKEIEYYNNPEYLFYEQSDDEEEQGNEQQDTDTTQSEQNTTEEQQDKEEEDDEPARKKPKKELTQAEHTYIRNIPLAANRNTNTGIGQWETISVTKLEEEDGEESEDVKHLPDVKTEIKLEGRPAPVRITAQECTEPPKLQSFKLNFSALKKK